METKSTQESGFCVLHGHRLWPEQIFNEYAARTMHFQGKAFSP